MLVCCVSTVVSFQVFNAIVQSLLICREHSFNTMHRNGDFVVSGVVEAQKSLCTRLLFTSMTSKRGLDVMECVYSSKKFEM